MSCEVCGEHKSELQQLLDEYNRGNKALFDKIKDMRGKEAPLCHGEDDCSIMALVHCPWSIDCGPEFST